MGRTQVEARLFATVSSHFSEQDKTDAALWDDLLARIQELVADPKYDAISPLMI